MKDSVLLSILFWTIVESSLAPLPPLDCFDIFPEDYRVGRVADISSIPNLNRRHPSDTVTTSDVSLNDKTLPPGWYGETGLSLIRYPPGLNRCGTRYPIWMSTEDTVCIQTETNVCSHSFDIQRYHCKCDPSDYRYGYISCDDYYIYDEYGEYEQHDEYDAYYLLQPEIEYASYCFDSSSDAGSVSFVNTPEINVNLVHEANYSSLVFHCDFTRSSEYQYYTTRWYVTRIIKDFGPVEWTSDSFDYIGETTLTEHMLISGGVEKAGFDIMCVVSATRGPDDVASVLNWSEKKFVGVEISRKYVYMNEGESQTIQTRSSVPFGCGVHGSTCSLNIEVIPTYSPESNCSVVDIKNNVVSTQAIDWNQWTSFEVFGKRRLESYSGLYSNKGSELKLKTSKNNPQMSPLWQNYDIGSVGVHVRKDSRGFQQKSCWEGLDPNFRTFNFRRVSFGNIGVFTMYKSEAEAIEVQIETEECGFRASCNCGLVVRVGSTVFDISRCQSQYWFADYTACGDRTDVLRVLRYWSSYNLKLYTGMEVRVALSTTFMRVTLTTAEFTDEGSEGLCGPVSDTGGLKMRNGGFASSVNEYVESWRVEDSQNLFNPEVIASGLTSTTVSAFCVNDWYWRWWKKVTPKHCDRNALSRRKRRASFQQTREKRSVPETWSNGWNESSAAAFCDAKFSVSSTVQAVQDITGVDVETFKWACVQDIKNSGTTNFSDDAVAAVRDDAIREALANPSLNQSDPQNPNAPTMYDIINRMTCPGDCNDRGTCNEGECQCSVGFGGDDCSVDLSLPPVIVEVGVEGHCDLAAEDCSRVDVFGNTFLDDKSVKCQLDRSQVSMSGGIESSGTSSTTAEHESLSKVTCELPAITQHDIVLSVDVSVSQAGDIYSNVLTVLVYDSTCVTVDRDTKTWTLMAGHCMHMGRCHSIGSTMKVDGHCWRCLTENGLPSWQREQGECQVSTDAGHSGTNGINGPGIVTLILAVGSLLM